MEGSEIGPFPEESDAALELLAIQSIYADIVLVEATEEPKNEFPVTITCVFVPKESDSEGLCYISFKLLIYLPWQYPSDGFQFTIERPRGLTEANQVRLNCELEQVKSNSGDSPLYSLIERAMELMREMNTPQGSCPICLCDLRDDITPCSNGPTSSRVNTSATMYPMATRSCSIPPNSNTGESSLTSLSKGLPVCDCTDVTDRRAVFHLMEDEIEWRDPTSDNHRDHSTFAGCINCHGDADYCSDRDQDVSLHHSESQLAESVLVSGTAHPVARANFLEELVADTRTPNGRSSDCVTSSPELEGDSLGSTNETPPLDPSACGGEDPSACGGEDPSACGGEDPSGVHLLGPHRDSWAVMVTTCYHHFHSLCPQCYATEQLHRYHELEPDPGTPRIAAIKPIFSVPCPVCRQEITGDCRSLLPLDTNHSSVTFDPMTLWHTNSGVTYRPDEAMQAMQEKMAAGMARQAKLVPRASHLDLSPCATR